MRTGTASPEPHRYPRTARVRARAEFDQVFKQGKRTASPLLALHWYQDDQPPRLGLAVSRKVDGRAVGRNRIKRILRERFRVIRPSLQGGAYVVVARPAAADAINQLIGDAFFDALRRAGALPQGRMDGTMPADSLPTHTAPRIRGE